jgi:hypothetical protein
MFVDIPSVDDAELIIALHDFETVADEALRSTVLDDGSFVVTGFTQVTHARIMRLLEQYDRTLVYTFNPLTLTIAKRTLHTNVQRELENTGVANLEVFFGCAPHTSVVTSNGGAQVVKMSPNAVTCGQCSKVNTHAAVLTIQLCATGVAITTIENTPAKNGLSN